MHTGWTTAGIVLSASGEAERNSISHVRGNGMSRHVVILPGHFLWPAAGSDRDLQYENRETRIFLLAEASRCVRVLKVWSLASSWH